MFMVRWNKDSSTRGRGKFTEGAGPRCLGSPLKEIKKIFQNKRFEEIGLETKDFCVVFEGKCGKIKTAGNNINSKIKKDFSV